MSSDLEKQFNEIVNDAEHGNENSIKFLTNREKLMGKIKNGINNSQSLNNRIKPISEMTDQEIDNEMAKILGWELINTDGAPTSDCIPEYIDPITEEHQVFFDEWHPHNDLNQVWRCVEKMAENGWFIDFFDDANSLCAKFTNIDTGKSSVCAYGSRPARIICEAMLMAIRDEHG